MQKKTLHIGITGGIGSGKTTIARLFAEFGIPIYNADDRAKALMQTDPNIIDSLTAAFSREVFLPDGTLNRAFLAEIVFNDAKQLAILNAITHPAVLRDSENWQKKHANAPYTLKEAALLIESGSYRQLDKLIVVVAPFELRIARTMLRDSCDREAVLARISKQLTDEQRLTHADYVITNDADLTSGSDNLRTQVERLHRLLIYSMEIGCGILC